MKRVTTIATALVLAVIAVLGTRVLAQETNTHEITYLTFSNTVEMPGVTLPAGTYTFRLADTPTRNVVQVLDRDQKNVMGQWLFVQAERPEVSQDTVVMFKENREGATPAVQYWYFPGERIGKEFIYPKDQAQKIASRTGQKVRTESGYATADTAVSSVDQQGQTSQWQREGAANQPADSSNAIHGASGLSADANNNNSSNDTLRNAPASSQPTASAGSLTGNRGANVGGDNNDNSSVNQNFAVNRDIVASPEPSSAPAQSAQSSSANQTVGTSGFQNDNNQQVTDTGRQARARQLPKTGSELPLAGLIGLLSLAGALGTRAVASARN